MIAVSLCPLRIAVVPWQPRHGAHAMLVVVKATYDLRPVESTLADVQEYPYEDENHWDDDAARSVYSPSDIAPFKPLADVVLVGHAFAPRREPVRSLVARLVVAGIDKTLEIHADRSRGPDGALREVGRFSRMPLRYERAPGGPDTDNPVGIHRDSSVVANLKRAGTPRLGEPPDVIGFGPIASTWPSRRRLLGPLASTFSAESWTKQPLPKQLDAAFFNVAPADQQVDRVGPGEHLVLENLNLEHPLLITNLPAARPRAFAARHGEMEEVRLTCDTLWIDTDRSTCTLTWRGGVGLAHPSETGRVVLLMDTDDAPLNWAAIREACVDDAAGDAGGTVDSDELLQDAPRSGLGQLGGSQRSGDLPFLLAKTSSHATEEHTSPSFRPDLARQGNADVLPFVPARPPPVSFGPPPPPLAAPMLHQPPPAPPPPRPPPPPVVAEPTAEPVALALSPRTGDPVVGGVLGASNAAASLTPWKSEAPPANPPPEATRSAPVAPAPRPPPAEVMDLIWFDPAALERIRAHGPWLELLRALQPKPPAIAYDDDPVPDEPDDVKNRRDLFGVLAGATPTSVGELDGALELATSDTGAFTPPLVLVAGELQLPLEELETLKTLAALAAPFASSDKKLKEAIEAANELAKSAPAPTALVETITSRLRDAFAQVNKALAPGALDAQAERMLLEQRRYQKRAVLGADYLRAILTQGTSPAVAYLPQAMANKLPLYARFKARLVAELALQQDQSETAPFALRVVALARREPPPRSKR